MKALVALVPSPRLDRPRRVSGALAGAPDPTRALTLLISIGMGGGCGAEYLAAGAGALGDVVVDNAKRGASAGTIAASGYAGRTDHVGGASSAGHGVSAQISSQGIASDGGLGLAARSRVELGAFGSDYWFGDIDLEVGGGVWLGERVGLGLTAGWRYCGYFDTRHTAPVRAIASLRVSGAFIYGSAHVSWNADDWASRGIDATVVLASSTSNGNLSLGASYERQDTSDVFGVSVGYAGLTVFDGGARAPRPDGR